MASLCDSSLGNAIWGWLLCGGVPSCPPPSHPKGGHQLTQLCGSRYKRAVSPAWSRIPGDHEGCHERPPQRVTGQSVCLVPSKSTSCLPRSCLLLQLQALCPCLGNSPIPRTVASAGRLRLYGPSAQSTSFLPPTETPRDSFNPLSSLRAVLSPNGTRRHFYLVH